MSAGNTVDTCSETWFTKDMAATTSPQAPKEGTMFSSFAVSCPCGCGEAVEARDAGFTATTVSVVCCETSQLGTVTVRKSWAYSNAAPTAGVRHADGLVVFA